MPNDQPSFRATELYRVLEDVDNRKAARIFQAFSETAKAETANMAEAAWALAQLQAQLLAAAPGELQLWWAGRLAEMCQLALPTALMAAQAAAHAAQPPGKPH